MTMPAGQKRSELLAIQLDKVVETQAKCVATIIRTSGKLAKLQRQEKSLARRVKKARRDERAALRMIPPAINRAAECQHNWLNGYCDLCGAIRQEVR